MEIFPVVVATTIWMRPAIDNWIGDSSYTSNYMDNFDLGALVAPVTLDGLKITPWGIAGGMGTNNIKMASYITGRETTDNSGRAVCHNMTDFNAPMGTYLTTSDIGLELNLDSTCKAPENQDFVLELGYIHLWLDKDAWGGYQKISVAALTTKTPGK